MHFKSLQRRHKDSEALQAKRAFPKIRYVSRSHITRIIIFRGYVGGPPTYVNYRFRQKGTSHSKLQAPQSRNYTSLGSSFQRVSFHTPCPCAADQCEIPEYFKRECCCVSHIFLNNPCISPKIPHAIPVYSQAAQVIL